MTSHVRGIVIGLSGDTAQESENFNEYYDFIKYYWTIKTYIVGRILDLRRINLKINELFHLDLFWTN